MTCPWESEHGWCEHSGRMLWLNSRLRSPKSVERVLTESVHIKCVDMKKRCKYE